jgi:hypothetical protein
MGAFGKVFCGAVAALVLIGPSGCGSAAPPYTPTSGQVFNGTKPAEGARVTLVPLDGKDDSAVRPSGIVGADGTFTVSTYDPATRKTHAGAPPGRYAVLVTWYPQAGLDSPNRGEPKSDRLGGRYKDATTSPFRAEVTDSPTELAPIRVSESGPKAKTSGPFDR